MATIAIVGDGPAGLSAALFLAKNGQQVVVFGDDGTAMHFAHLKNYLGVEEVPGPDFQKTAVAQVQAVGAEIRRDRVATVTADDDGFTITAEDGSTLAADYVVLAEGRQFPIAESLGVETGEGILVDSEFRTSVPGVYAAGRSVRPHRSQAIISAGAGATAALDILAEVTGDAFKDWDSMPKE